MLFWSKLQKFQTLVPAKMFSTKVIKWSEKLLLSSQNEKPCLMSINSLCKIVDSIIKPSFLSSQCINGLPCPQTSFLEPPPSFCYVLQASVTRPPVAVLEAVRDRLPSVSRAPDTTRMDLFGKMLYYSPEVSYIVYNYAL